MTSPGSMESRPNLRLVRDPEIEAIENEDIRVVEAYCDELLIDEHGNPRDEAKYYATRFRHSENEWTQVRFRRENFGYMLSFFGENTVDGLVYEVSMQPFRSLLVRPPAPIGTEWYVQYGKPGVNDEFQWSFNPADFRSCLEELWGSLPLSVRGRLGIQQSPPQRTS